MKLKSAVCLRGKRPLLAARTRISGAFTLIEMLTVLSVMTILWALTVPAFTGVLSAHRLSSAAANLSGTVERSVLFARAQNTYVWLRVGAEEEGVTLDGFFSRDGTDDGQDPANVTSAWGTQNLNGVELVGSGGGDGAVRPMAEVKFGESGGWLVISPRGEVRSVVGSGESIPESPGQPVRRVEIAVREIGVRGPNVAIIQIAGLTGQGVIYRP